MDFKLDIPSPVAMDYLTPLYVDTNIEYTLDMEKFPELTDPSHYWKPALMIDSNSSPSSEPCQMNLCMIEGSEETVQEQTFKSMEQDELYQLIDSLDIDIPELDTLDGAQEVNNDVFEWNSFHSEEEYRDEMHSSSHLSSDCIFSKNTDGFYNTCFENNSEFLDRGTSCHQPKVSFSTRQVQLSVNCDTDTPCDDDVSKTGTANMESYMGPSGPTEECGMTIPKCSLSKIYARLSKSKVKTSQLHISTYTSERFLINGDSSCNNKVGCRQW